jgi:diacylglycerol kinase family enzyme
MVSLVAAVLLVVAVLVVVVHHLTHILVGLVGLGLVVAGGWWLITTGRVARRVVGGVGVAAGLALIVWAVVRAAATATDPGLRLAVVAGLALISVGAARLALVHDVHELQRRQPVRRTPPAHPVLICNPWSGGGKVGRFGLVELAAEMGVETVLLDHGLDLEQLARDAVARGADCLAMAGGDGSQALVASIAVEHDLPFVCITAGTRNHFALDLGLDREDPRNSMAAFTEAVERRIDYATVNGRFFVNNVSLGIYATIVQQEGYRDNKVDTSTTLLPELLGQQERPFDLQFEDGDGHPVDGAYLIQVSNNPYVLGATLDVAQRRRMDTGRLGVFAVTGATGRDAAEIVTLAAIGQRRLARNWHEFEPETFEVRSTSGTAYAGVDGEALELDTPMTFAIHPRGLRLLVPEGNLALADRRQARQVTLGHLVKVARGIDPLADPEPVPPEG